ncbi:MAG: hypothetical protein FIA99_09960 [Ruminiclostridium sp.]|nr:hypothetical protein [Ruminiclostridium sp.]
MTAEAANGFLKSKQRKGVLDMTVHDFIMIYNESFKYIENKYGTDALKDLWETISKQWCTHLRELVSEYGLEGMLKYWGGEDGTLGREKAEYEVSLKDGIFKGIMNVCPSVGELKERGRDIYHGKLTYCDHCTYLYVPIADENGYNMTWDIEYDMEGGCTGRCSWKSWAGENRE